MSSTPRFPTSVTHPALATREAASIVLGLWVEVFNLSNAIVQPRTVESRDGRRSLDDDAADDYMSQLGKALSYSAVWAEGEVAKLDAGSLQALAYQRVMSWGPESSDLKAHTAKDREPWITALTSLDPSLRASAIIGATSPSFLAYLRCFNLKSGGDFVDARALPSSVQDRVNPQVQDALGPVGQVGERRYFQLARGALSDPTSGERFRRDVKHMRRCMGALGDGLVAPILRAAIDTNGPFPTKADLDTFIGKLERPKVERSLPDARKMEPQNTPATDVLKFGPISAWADLQANPNKPMEGHLAARQIIRANVNPAARVQSATEAAGLSTLTLSAFTPRLS